MLNIKQVGQSHAKTCPFCKEDFEIEAVLYSCNDCSALMHTDCWAEHPKCMVCESESKKKVEITPDGEVSDSNAKTPHESPATQTPSISVSPRESGSTLNPETARRIEEILARDHARQQPSPTSGRITLNFTEIVSSQIYKYCFGLIGILGAIDALLYLFCRVKEAYFPYTYFGVSVFAYAAMLFTTIPLVFVAIGIVLMFTYQIYRYLIQHIE